LFKLTANTGYRCSALGRIEVRTGSRPGGCPGPMRRSWLRRNRLTEPSRISRTGAREGCLLSDRERQESLHFFGETPERRPWAIKREDRPAAFAGRSQLLTPRLSGIPPVSTRVSILSRCFTSRCTRKRANSTYLAGTTVRRSRENNVTRYRTEYSPVRALPSRRVLLHAHQQYCDPIRHPGAYARISHSRLWPASPRRDFFAGHRGLLQFPHHPSHHVVADTPPVRAAVSDSFRPALAAFARYRPSQPPEIRVTRLRLRSLYVATWCVAHTPF